MRAIATDEILELVFRAFLLQDHSFLDALMRLAAAAARAGGLGARMG